MLIQPFIENALWHGIKADDRKINIDIAFKKVGREVVCLIEDNGIGIEASLKQNTQSVPQHHSMGISNIKNRIQLLNEKYHLQFLLTIEDKKNLKGYSTSGTLVTLRLPIKSGIDE
jgi:sensor histidine kinase YesM